MNETKGNTELKCSAIFAEVEKATAKFPTWPTDPLHALSVLGEEFGELTKEVVQLVYEPHKSSKEAVRDEAIQTAAMAIRFVLSLDSYEYQRGEQHLQGVCDDQPLVKTSKDEEYDSLVNESEVSLALKKANVDDWCGEDYARETLLGLIKQEK